MKKKSAGILTSFFRRYAHLRWPLPARVHGFGYEMNHLLFCLVKPVLTRVEIVFAVKPVN